MSVTDNLVKLLPDNIANQIAAGEVIQRPASVVKELVENAVDAGATDIFVQIKEAGKTLIQVIDNGKGMAPLDARMAFERHATSKIRQADDLFALTTLGFRGEALPSIAAVAHVTLQTRPAGAEQGIKVELEGSKVLLSEPCNCAQGANFAVKHLFYNVPARRKFLKQDETEFRHILSEVQNVAAVHPDIAFTLQHNDHTTLQLRPASLRQRIVDLFGKRLAQSLLPLEANSPLGKVYGFISRVEKTRKRGALQYFFTNGRYMKHPYFHRMVVNAYGNMIPKGEYPEYFLYIEVNPADIDVNISPTKTEIKFAEEQSMGSVLYSAVREALMVGSASQALSFLPEGEEQIAIPTQDLLNGDELTEPPLVPDFVQVTSKIGSEEEDEMALPFLVDQQFEMPDMSDWESFYSKFEAQRSVANSRASVSTLKPSSSATTPAPMVPLSAEEEAEQLPEPWLYQEYALFPSPQGITFMHIARARQLLLYHQLKQSLERGTVLSGRLLFPSLLELNAEESALLARCMGTLMRLGFDISEMGQRSYAINAVPDGIPAGTEEELLRELLAEYQQAGSASNEVLLERLVLLLTKRRTYNHQASATDARTLYLKITQLPHHHITPEGAKVLSLLTVKELGSKF